MGGRGILGTLGPLLCDLFFVLDEVLLLLLFSVAVRIERIGYPFVL